MKTVPAAHRAAIHMAQALPDLPPRRHSFQPWLWKLWMTLAALAVLSAVVAVGVITILRRGL